ncbi:MAG: hypothetical protein ACK6DS_19830 [Planctomycetota bacterium]
MLAVVSDSLRRIAEDVDAANTRQLNMRPPMTDVDFHSRFYSGTDVTLEVVERVRRILAEQLALAGARPEDNLALLFPDTPFAEICWEIGEKVGLKFPDQVLAELDGPLDHLIRTTQSLIDGKPCGA